MTAGQEKPIAVDPDFDPSDLRCEFDPEDQLNTMVDQTMAFFAYQRYYRASPVEKRPATIELTHARDAFCRSLDSYGFAVTHTANPNTSEVLHQIAQQTESELLPMLREHSIQPGIFGNYGNIFEQAGGEALRLQMLADLGRGKTFEIQSYAGLS